MSIDIVKLASDITQHLLTSTALVSILQAIGRGTASELGKNLLITSSGKTKELFEKLWPRLESHPTAIEAVKDLALQPDDLGNQASLQKELKVILSEEESFANKIAQIFEETKPEGAIKINASGNRNVSIGGSVHGNIITGDGETKAS